MRRLLAPLLALAGLAAPARAAPEDPPAPAQEQAIVAAVEEIRDQVARIRGLPWKRRVEAEVLTREQLGRKLDQWFREDVDEEELEKAIRSLRRFGMLGEDEDLLELFKSMMAEGILAYYDPDTGRIYVVLGPALDALRPTICHELVHALEDQHGSLQDAKDAVEEDADQAWALECVIEGSAERGRVLWEAAHPELARRAREAGDDPRVQAGMKSVLENVPAYLILPTQFHYQRGLAFVERLTGSDFPGGMERLRRDPPVTQEQVLHPGRYGKPGPGALRDHPRRIEWRPDLPDAAGAGWALVDDEPSGELDFALWVDYFLGTCKGRIDVDLLRQGEWCAPEARLASEGWDGARVAFFRREGAPLAIVEGSAWDTPLDAREAAGAMVKTLRARHGKGFVTTGWTYPPGSPPGPLPDETPRTIDYVADGLTGRMQVRGDTILWLEGLPPEPFARVWDALLGTRFERDRRDRWSPATEPHPFEGADWRADAHGVAWRRPDAGWTVEFSGAEKARAKRAGVSLEITADQGEVQDVFRRLPAGLQYRVRNGQVTPENAVVRGQPAARMAYESSDAETGDAVRNLVVLVDLDGDHVLVVRAQAAATDDTFDSAVEQALDGLIVAGS